MKNTIYQELACLAANLRKEFGRDYKKWYLLGKIEMAERLGGITQAQAKNLREWL